MTEDPVDVLDDLADRVANEYADVTPIVDNSDADRPTLIVHLEGGGIQEAPSLADRIAEFLREHGARTERERHSETDIRVLATVD